MLPSAFLGLPFKSSKKRPCETDRVLLHGLALHESSRCSCGCNHRAEDCTDEDKANRWQPFVVKHYAGAALAEFRKEHSEDLDDGSMVGVRLLPEGEAVVDPLTYDPAAAKREFEAMQRRLGL